MRLARVFAAVIVVCSLLCQTKSDQGIIGAPGATYDFSLAGSINMGHLLTTGDLTYTSLQGLTTSVDAAQSWCKAIGAGGNCMTLQMPASLGAPITVTWPAVSTGLLNEANSAVCIGTVPTTNTTTYFLTPGANGGNACNAAGNNVGVGNPQPYACTGKNLFVSVGTTPSASTTDTFKLQKNGVDSGITCTITNPTTTCSDTTHTIAFAAGDSWLLAGITGAATDATAQVRMGFQCQ